MGRWVGVGAWVHLGMHVWNGAHIARTEVSVLHPPPSTCACLTCDDSPHETLRLSYRLVFSMEVLKWGWGGTDHTDEPLIALIRCCTKASTSGHTGATDSTATSSRKAPSAAFCHSDEMLHLTRTVLRSSCCLFFHIDHVCVGVCVCVCVCACVPALCSGSKAR